MRLDVFDVLVGINLLREGLDIPEITLVAILDADKEGFLRSETSLIQTIGRAARNSEGHVIMYADTITDSMRLALDETERRRAIQMAYNEEHGITPKTIRKSVRDLISISKKVAREEMQLKKDPESMSKKESGAQPQNQFPITKPHAPDTDSAFFLIRNIFGCCGGTEFRGSSPAA